jgi:hypothetical protein
MNNVYSAGPPSVERSVRCLVRGDINHGRRGGNFTALRPPRVASTKGRRRREPTFTAAGTHLKITSPFGESNVNRTCSVCMGSPRRGAARHRLPVPVGRIARGRVSGDFNPHDHPCALRKVITYASWNVAPSVPTSRTLRRSALRRLARDRREGRQPVAGRGVKSPPRLSCVRHGSPTPCARNWIRRVAGERAKLRNSRFARQQPGGLDARHERAGYQAADCHLAELSFKDIPRHSHRGLVGDASALLGVRRESRATDGPRTRTSNRPKTRSKEGPGIDEGTVTAFPART